MNIALISSPMLLCPPSTYGGSEIIVWNLANALTELGHKVLLFAPKGSQVPKNGFLIECPPPALKVQIDWLEAERKMYETYRPYLKDFEGIIHGHGWFGFEYRLKAEFPHLAVTHTHHGGLNLSWWKRSEPPFKLNMIAISQWMKSVYERQGFPAKYVYNGVNIKKYPFKAKKGKRLLYVGRFSTFKQPHIAIEVAKNLNMPIDLVGGSFVDDPNYLEQIKSMCDGDKIKMHLDASHETKIELMQKAKCLLFPSRMGEPFGLVAVESMACGRPVVALNDGAIAEVVKEGGIVCLDKDAMVDAVKQVHRITARACRKNAERFSRENMAKTYLKLYRQILSGDEW